MSDQITDAGKQPTGDVNAASVEAISRGNIRKAGRHKKDCLCENCVARRANPPKEKDQTASVSPTVSPIDADIIKQTFAEFLRSIDDISCRRIYLQTLQLTQDNKLATEMAESCKIRESELTSMSTCVGVIAQKYQLAGKYLPEAILGIGLTVYTVRHINTHKKLVQLVKMNAAARPYNAADRSAATTASE